MLDDTDGNWPKWATKVLIGVAVITALAIVTIATAGTGTAVAAIAAIALNGSIIGASIGATSGAAIGAVSHRVTTGSWDGAGMAALDGAANGFMIGSITGAISGGIQGYSDYSSASLKSNGANPKEVLSSYRGTPKVQTLQTETTAYRSWGGQTNELGHWVSPNNYGSNVRNMLSLPPGNTAANISTFTLSRGTIVLAGRAAPLFGQAGGGVQWWVPFIG